MSILDWSVIGFWILAITLMVYATVVRFKVLLDLSLWNAIAASMADTVVYTFLGGSSVR